MAASTIQLPGVGPVNRRVLLIGGGAAVLVMGVLWYRKRQAAQAAAATPTAQDVADASADDSTGDIVSGQGSGGTLTGTGGGVNSGPGTFTNNAQWTQYAEQVLDPTQVDGGTSLSVALGLYITGRPVSSAQELLVDQAISVAGYPPVTGPTGYPPGIRQTPNGGGGTTGGGGGVTKAKLATRNGNLGATLASTTQTTWSGLFRWAYHGYDGGQINRYAYLLAKANGHDSASTSPKTFHNIHLPETLS